MLQIKLEINDNKAKQKFWQLHERCSQLENVRSDATM
jgi:hypothetical protein